VGVTTVPEISRAGREGTDRERIEEAHAVEHHLAWQNAQPGHARVVCARNKTTEQNQLVFSIFFFVKNRKSK
jgi:hypothetical protein